MNLTEALDLAETAHAGQFYGAQDYFTAHVIPVVAYAIREYSDHRDVRDIAIAAALHDAVEDTYLTLTGLRELGAPEAVVRAVDAVTRRDGEAYMETIGRARQDRLGRLVKLADNYCNLQESIRDGDERRIVRYQKARAALLATSCKPGRAQ